MNDRLGGRHVVVTLGHLDEGYVLAPERHLAQRGAGRSRSSVALAELVRERRERIEPSSEVVVCDTTHARDGVLDVASAIRDGAGIKSAKKAAYVGDLVISRLRPYLRQIALVSRAAFPRAVPRPLALSTEFYVLTAREAGDDLAFLLPFLLGPEAQAALADAQEGGHHPRVPTASLFSLRVPRALIDERVARSREVNRALDDAYRASARLREALTLSSERRTARPSMRTRKTGR